MSLELWDELDESFTLYGIRSKGMSETRFIYNFNKYFDFKFERVEDLDICIDNQLYCFSLYAHFNEIDDSEWYLIRNHSHIKRMENPSGLLFDDYGIRKVILSKLKIFDYLLKIPLGSEDERLNQVPLTKYNFIQKINLITSLSNKEKKLLYI